MVVREIVRSAEDLDGLFQVVRGMRDIVVECKKLRKIPGGGRGTIVEGLVVVV